MNEIPPVIARYIEGLKTHDVGRVAGTVADDLAFVTPARTMAKPQFLAFLRALYAGFPDWRYDHDPPRLLPDGAVAVRWRQGGTHTATLALPGFDAVPATGRTVAIPEHDFFYQMAGDRIVEIRPDPVPGGAPPGIFQQIGVRLPPLWRSQAAGKPGTQPVAAPCGDAVKRSQRSRMALAAAESRARHRPR